MLDELFNLVIGQLDLNQSEVDAWIEQIGSEIAVDNIGQTRRRQLLSVLRSGRPVDAQIDSFEKTYWKMEEDAAPKLKDAIVPLLALALQRRKIEALKARRAEQRDMPAVQQTGNVHEDYLNFCLSLDRLGGTHSKVGQFSEAERAVIADLARWKAEDPRFEQPGNPWIDVRAIYAERTMERRQEGQRVRSMSRPGAPPRERQEPGSTRYWRFEPGKHHPFWQRTAQPTAVRYVELPAGLAISAAGNIVSERTVDDLARAQVTTEPRKPAPSAESKVETSTASEVSPQSLKSAGQMTPPQTSPSDVFNFLPSRDGTPPATPTNSETNFQDITEQRAEAIIPAVVTPASAGMPEDGRRPPAAALPASEPREAPNESATPIDNPAEDQAETYREIARKIIRAKFEGLWRAIGLDAGPKGIYSLELKAEEAADRGLKHEYLDEIRDLVSYRIDTSFIEEIVERDSVKLAATLAEDASQRSAMRTAGFDVPYPTSHVH